MPGYQTVINVIESDLISPIYRNRSENSTQTSQLTSEERNTDLGLYGPPVPDQPPIAPNW